MATTTPSKHGATGPSGDCRRGTRFSPRTARDGRPQRRLRWFALTFVVAALSTSSGCIFTGLLAAMYLIQGAPMRDPEFGELDGRRVAVVAHLEDHTAAFDFPSVHHALAERVARKFAENNIEVVPPAQVARWLDEHDWNEVQEVGRALDAEYVVYLEVRRFTVQEQSSMTMFRGRAAVHIEVHKIGESASEVVFSKEFDEPYPREQSISMTDISRRDFYNAYLEALSSQIGRLFYPWLPGEEVYDF